MHHSTIVQTLTPTLNGVCEVDLSANFTYLTKSSLSFQNEMQMWRLTPLWSCQYSLTFQFELADYERHFDLRNVILVCSGSQLT